MDNISITETAIITLLYFLPLLSALAIAAFVADYLERRNNRKNQL